MRAEALGPPRVLYQAVDTPCNKMALCEFPEGPGGRFLLLTTGDGAVQRAYLDAVGRRFPVDYDGETLRACLPFREGTPFPRYEREEEPDFARRKRICLELLEGIVEDRVPPELLARMLSLQNVVLAREGARLQYVLDFSVGASPEEAYSGLARLCFSLLNAGAGLTEANAGRYPPEYRLLWRRAEAGEYRSAEQLLQSLRALPDECSPWLAVHTALERADRGKRLLQCAAKTAVALLAALAAYCAVGAALRAGDQSAQEVNHQHTGIEQIGDQSLTGEDAESQ